MEKLGTFIEVEAIDETGEFQLNELKKQCDYYYYYYYYDYFDIQQEQVEQLSYSDLLIDKTEKL